MPFYPAGVERRIENRSEAEKIQPILARIIKQIEENQKELQQTQQHADDLDRQANAASRAGDSRKALMLTQDAIKVRKQAKTIKAAIAELERQHESLLYRARSGSGVEYR